MITRIHAKQEKRTSPPPGRKLMETEPSDIYLMEDTVDVSQSTGKVTPLLIPNTSRPCLSDAVLDQQVTSEVIEDASHVSCFILTMCVPIHFVLALTSLALHRLATSKQSLSEDEFTFTTVLAYVLAAFLQVSFLVCSVWFHRVIPMCTSYLTVVDVISSLRCLVFCTLLRLTFSDCSSFLPIVTRS
ncbi:hypothetical protein AHF37_06986 [Paragonimus kellicotti]|nr:hypothetical protein AHF37_06986 [Paragonimus kellicotti]